MIQVQVAESVNHSTASGTTKVLTERKMLIKKQVNLLNVRFYRNNRIVVEIFFLNDRGQYAMIELSP